MYIAVYRKPYSTRGFKGQLINSGKNGTLKLNREAIREAGRYDGKYLIRTSDDTLSAEDVALGYKQLVDVEDAFRTLKTTLKIRPMYHRLEERIRAHITISWLALLMVRMAEVKTGLKWTKIRDELQRLHIGHFSSNNGDVYKTTQATQKQLEILKALGVKPPPRLFDIELET